MSIGVIISIWLIYTSSFAFGDMGAYIDINANVGEINVTSYTTSSISFKWTYPVEYEEDSYTYVLTRASPQVRIGTPATLEWKNQTGRYYAEFAHRPGDVIVRWDFDKSLYDLLRKEVYINIFDLPFPGTTYLLEAKRIEQTEEGKNKTIRAKHWTHTQAIFPVQPPKSGAGLFYVYNVYPTNRRVKLFWQGIYGSGSYQIQLYEHGNRKPYHTATGSSEYAYAWCLVSLKRTYVLLKSINDVGESQNFSVITIPAQDEILPAIPIQWNYTKSVGRYQISWQKPENITVSNYTVTWVDRIEGKTAYRIADFVHLPSNVTSFEVDSETQWVELALSVNTPTTSSGLQIARIVDCNNRTQALDITKVIRCGEESEEVVNY